jgi:hypothetical protein
MKRGTVVPLTATQRLNRMRWLAGLATIDQLDPFIAVKPRDLLTIHKIPGYEGAKLPLKICAGYYRLNDKKGDGTSDGYGAQNGGKDPTALDPFDRWQKKPSTFINITADCIGGMAWCGGFDRYQPVRFAHLYDGWINTDSMWCDAMQSKKCFRVLDRPEPGCFVVFTSGSNGHKVGHIGGVIAVPAEWDGSKLECWQSLRVVDQAGRIGRANLEGNPITWYYAHGKFIIPTMQADSDLIS